MKKHILATLFTTGIILTDSYASIALSSFTTDEEGWDTGKWTTETSPNGLSESNPYLRLNPNGIAPRRGVIMFNTAPDWTGNYATKGVTAIRLHVRNQSTLGESIYLRAAIGTTGNPMSGTWFASSLSTIVDPSSGWQQIEIPISEETMIKSSSAMEGGTSGPDTFDQVYENVFALRILSQRSRRSAIAETSSGEVYIDNVQIIPEPQTIGILTLSSLLLLLERNKGTHPSLRSPRHYRLLTDKLDKFVGEYTKYDPT